MRALIVALIAASLLFTSGVPSSAGRLKSFMEALMDLQKTPEESVDPPPPPPPPPPKTPQ